MFLRRLFGIFFLCSILVTPAVEPARGQLDPVSPVLVKDINTCTESAYPDLIAQTNSVMYFLAYQANTGSSLWRTDGTDAGTVRIKTFEAGITVQKGWKNLWLGDSFFFLTMDGTQVYSLWISDGTDAGTRRVKDLIPAFEH